MFCMSLLKKANRDEFKADEAKYLDRYKLTSAQREAILNRQWNRMLEVGGNIYFTAKLGATDGLSFQQVAAIMTGRTQREYADVMLKGGRPAARKPLGYPDRRHRLFPKELSRRSPVGWISAFALVPPVSFSALVPAVKARSVARVPCIAEPRGAQIPVRTNLACDSAEVLPEIGD